MWDVYRILFIRPIVMLSRILYACILHWLSVKTKVESATMVPDSCVNVVMYKVWLLQRPV